MSENPQNPSQPVVPVPTFVYNPDVILLSDQIGRFVVELFSSDSANREIITDADAIRWTSYLDAIDTRVKVITEAPVLDLPQTAHSVKWPVEPLSPVPSMNNDNVEGLTRLFTIMHAELLNSTSNSACGGLSVFDAARITAVNAKTRSYLAAFRVPPTGLDMPASSPWDPTTPVAR